MRLSRPSTKAMLHPEKKLFHPYLPNPFFVLPDIYPSHSTGRESCALPKGRWSSFERHPGSSSARLSQVASLNLALFAQPQEGDKNLSSFLPQHRGMGALGSNLKAKCFFRQHSSLRVLQNTITRKVLGSRGTMHRKLRASTAFWVNLKQFVLKHCVDTSQQKAHI